MSSWDTSGYGYDPGQQQGFYNPNGQPDGASFYGNYGSGNVSSYSTGGVSFMTPAPLDNAGPYGAGGETYDDEFANEPPLLEELGINPEHIFQKTLAVLNPFRATRADVAGDADLAGPLAFCLAFGSLLLLVGKIHFNYIYGIGALGCMAIYGLLTLMATKNVSFCVIVSVLGYCILPIVMLSALSVLVSLQGVIGTLCAAVVVIWCSLSASNLFVTAFDMERQQLLVAYPCSMFYAVFALITIF